MSWTKPDIRVRPLVVGAKCVFSLKFLMAAPFRICLVILFLFVSGCVTREEAKHERGLPALGDSNIPEATPGPGIEKIQTRPDATPTPPPKNPMDRPLDPTGLPQG
jgi:hypothetical protein